MKMRKALSFVLVLALVLGSFSMVFAATDNVVVNTPTVADDEQMPVVGITLEVKDALGFAADKAQKIRLTLTNAEWAAGADGDFDAVDPAERPVVNADVNIAKNAVGIKDAKTASPVTLAVETLDISDNSIEFTFKPAAALVKGDVLSLQLNLHSGEEAGEVKVAIDGLDSQVSSGTYVVGVVGTDNTVATVTADPVNTGRTTAVKAAPIRISEVAVNSVAGVEQTIKLTLPKGVTWVAGDHGDANTTVISNDMVKATPGPTYTLGADGRDLVIKFTANGANIREALTITPYINIGKDARLGDIEVQIRGQNDSDISDASGLVIAKYQEEGVTVTTVKEKDIPTIYAGREMKDDNKNYVVEVTLEEIQAGSLIEGRYVNFEFPEWVQIVDSDDDPDQQDDLGGIVITTNNGNDGVIDPKDGNVNKNRSSFEWEVPALDANKATKFTFEIPVTVEADKTGDVELVVTGAKAGVDETTLVVATVEAPITAEMKVSDIKTGVQNQKINDIIIKETKEGAMREAKVSIWIDSNNQLIDFSKANVEVIGGDLDIKEANDKNVVKDGMIEFTVDRSSIKTPAEIKISGIEITMDRTPAEGKYALNIGGASIVDNDEYNDGDFAGAVVAGDYINVVTPADQGVNSQFVIGEKTYTVNGVEKTMDAEAYIDTAGRTMVPIRYIADSLGIGDGQIIWNQASVTATIVGKQVVSITVGDAKIIAGGTAIPMDTVAVNKDGRVYVPARYIATALGASVDWDAATKTVSIYTVK